MNSRREHALILQRHMYYKAGVYMGPQNCIVSTFIFLKNFADFGVSLVKRAMSPVSADKGRILLCHSLRKCVKIIRGKNTGKNIYERGDANHRINLTQPYETIRGSKFIV